MATTIARVVRHETGAMFESSCSRPTGTGKMQQVTRGVAGEEKIRHAQWQATNRGGAAAFVCERL